MNQRVASKRSLFDQKEITDESFDSLKARLSAILFPVEFRKTLATTKHLTILPVGAISSIPLTLLNPIGNQERVVDRFSVNFMLYFTEVAQPVKSWDRSFESTLVLGNPKGKDIFWTLEDLPEAATEAKNVAEKLGATPFIESDATTIAFIDRARTADLIYIAGHGISADGPEQDPLRESYIALADGRLTAATITRLSLKAKLVVLSACQTGLGRVTESAVVGLARAFLDAGSENAVMTLWSVDDFTTRILMSEYVELLAHHPPAEALRLAQLQLSVAHRFPETVYWSGFSVFGKHMMRP